MMYLVEYEVRKQGAQGVYRLKADKIEADSISEAQEKFRQKWEDRYDIRFPSRCEVVPTEK